jgi:hypothetical protein
MMLWWGASLHDDLQAGFLLRTMASQRLGGPRSISPCSPKNSLQQNSLIMEINSLIPSCYAPIIPCSDLRLQRLLLLPNV